MFVFEENASGWLDPLMKVRIRSREQNGRSTYTVTKRDLVPGKDFVETRYALVQSHKAYSSACKSSSAEHK
ncbi:unnamed protein product [Strongylus vulgaris]|uniref:Uncharacterized protein n=1 Tax=Strongylus vulgaris TaxID=40348 RepID=A0A3P7M1U0_STRVU|nr:unnamed protein product [Strongylus vulgaris]